MSVFKGLRGTISPYELAYSPCSSIILNLSPSCFLSVEETNNSAMVEQKVDSDDEFKDCIDDFAARKTLFVTFSSLFHSQILRMSQEFLEIVD